MAKCVHRSEHVLHNIICVRTAPETLLLADTTHIHKSSSQASTQWRGEAWRDVKIQVGSGDMVRIAMVRRVGNAVVWRVVQRGAARRVETRRDAARCGMCIFAYD